jgi:hypothetical protein
MLFKIIHILSICLSPVQTLSWLTDHLYVDMFRSLRVSGLADEHVFSVTVGARSKQTLARWHLLEPADVISTISLLNSKHSDAVY